MSLHPNTDGLFSWSYRKTSKINFHDANKLSKILLTYSVLPRVPTRLCSLPPSLLLYEDVTSVPHEIRWLDCSTATIKPADGVHVTKTQQRFIQDMCCVQVGDKTLVVATSGFGGAIYAYNTAQNAIEWTVEGRLPGMRTNMKPHGVTTDGQGHLFVCDSDNKCIQMFSMDGEFMGSVLKEETQGFDQLAAICWSWSSNSLILVHRKNLKCSISIIRDVAEGSQPAIQEPAEEEDADVQITGTSSTSQVHVQDSRLHLTSVGHG